MSLPIDSILTICAEQFTSAGELPAALRKHLLLQVEALSVAEHANAGRLRRARLGILCASRVQNALQVWPELARSVRRALASAVQVLAGELDPASLEQINMRLQPDVVNLLEQGEGAFVAVYAGLSAVAAINTVLYDTDFEAVGENEQEVDPDTWDPSFYASLAACGGAVWENGPDEHLRREFWTWYLHEAVPMAWDVRLSLNTNFH